jgi:hypothetical protein
MIKYINLPLLIISFILGLFYNFFSKPEVKKVYVYPTPENVDKIQYKDLLNNCFSFKYKKLNCNEVDENNLKNIPLQY